MNRLKTTHILSLLFIVGIGMAVNGYSQSFLTNGLVAYFPFDGNADDASGNEFNGTVNGATLTTNRFGQANQAYLFGGPSAYITAPMSSTVFSNDFTASVWFNAYDISGGWPTLLHEENNSLTLQMAGNICGCDAPGYLIAYSSFGSRTFSWFLPRRKQTPLNTYCQVVVTKAGTNVTMYLNAQVEVTSQVNNPTTQVGNTLWIGRAPTEDLPGAYVFHGVLDDIRIYERALSEDEVVSLYEYESGPRVNLIKAVKPSFSALWTGTNYQMQLSPDMNTWTNHGSPFTATNTSMIYPQYWDVENWDKLFFRLQISP